MLLRLRPSVRLANGMPGFVLEHVLKELRRVCLKPVRLVWTAPVGPDLLLTSLSLADFLLQGRVRHELRTDGSDLNEECVSFLARREVEVTVALDGPPEIHDGNRGAGTHARALLGLKSVQQKGAPVRVRCTVTPRTLPWAESVLDYLDDLGSDEIDFVPAVELVGSQVRYGLEPGEFGRFLSRVYLRARGRPARTRVRLLDSLGRRMLGRVCADCRFG
ncbi:MAG: hypothetical protein AB1758_17690, partial [Candidatus Eremiobacterota bacterium]